MRVYNVFLFFVLIIFANCTQGNKQELSVHASIISKNIGAIEPINIDSSGLKFNILNTEIRDGLISKPIAMQKFQTLIKKITTLYYIKNGRDFEKTNWIFPLEGYNSSAIGGKNGSGYIGNGFNYFDGNGRKGHPAHDLFIRDERENKIDIRTKKPVNVLSMTEGIVIALEMKWDTLSNLQGGKYIYVYVPSKKQIIYYAHNDTVFVKLGDIVVPGDTIATVGRSGYNAFKKRSPTHLHIMVMQLDSVLLPKPINPYNDLLKCKIKD